MHRRTAVHLRGSERLGQFLHVRRAKADHVFGNREIREADEVVEEARFCIGDVQKDASVSARTGIRRHRSSLVHREEAGERLWLPVYPEPPV